MGREPLPPAASVSLSSALGAYADHPDPTTRLANTVALLVGSNGPFYPLYVWWLVPEAGPGSLATMAATPAFLAIPWLARHQPALARVALPLVGLANTLWTVLLLGSGSGVGAFVTPCLLLAALAWREPAALLGVLGAGLLTLFATLHWPLPPLATLAGAQQAALVPLNTMSAGALIGVIVFSAARALRQHCHLR